MSTLKKLHKVIQKPRYAMTVALALLRGTYYILYFRLFRKKVIIRFPFKAFTKVTIDGPGSVFIDRNCNVIMTLFRGLSIVTLTPEAQVVIGRHGHLGGMTIRCRKRIVIGEEIRTAAALVQDAMILHDHWLQGNDQHADWLTAKPVMIGDNVWLAGQSVTLGGCRIGTDSVVGGGAVCAGSDIGDAHVVFGNPGKRPLPIDRLLQLKGEI